VKFAYRLFDLDGSGALDQNEAVTVLRDAMRSDLSQYGQRGALPKIDLSQKDSIRALVDDISSRTGTGDIQIGEFEVQLRPVRLARGPCTDSLLAQMMCSRMPRIYQPAKYLFLLMHKTSKEAFRAVSHMSPAGLEARAHLRCAADAHFADAAAGAHRGDREAAKQGRAADV
jgi:hypothetical protein